jgi:RNA polymerase sigma-54 factor
VEVSNKTVKDIIAHMVQHETVAEPLADQEIQERLKKQGIPIARRTVAKYRLMLRIPPSHERRRPG